LIPILLAEWALEFLYVAILVRVFSSWLPISPYSRWIRWSYVTTEWLLAPLRRIIPPFGAIDVSPLGALLLIWLARGIIGRL
jgi:YggT family protein